MTKRSTHEELIKIARELESVSDSSKDGNAASKDSKEIFIRVFQTNSALMAVSTVENGRLVQVNDEFLRNLEYEKHEVIGKTFLELNLFSDDTQWEALHHAIKAKGHIRNIEVTILAKNRSVRFASLSADLIRLKNKKCLLTVLNDITRRKEIEEALRESEAKYRTILENIEEGYYETDIAGNFTFFNTAMCRILGYPEDQIMGMNYRQYMDQETAHTVYQTFNQVYKTGAPFKAFDWEIIRNDASKIFVEASVSLIKDHDGRETGFRGIVRDITERKKADDAIKINEKKLSTLFQNANDIIVFQGVDGKIIDINDKIEDSFGLKRQDVIGRNVSEFAFLNKQDETESIMRREKLQTGEVLPMVEYEFLRKDNSKGIFEINSRLIEGPGDIKGFISTIRDITERKRSEEEKKRLVAKLERARKMEEIGTLAGGVAHDLNNVLSGIIGYPDLLLMQIPQDSPFRKSIIAIQESGKKAAAIVQDLLTLARRGVETNNPVNLNDIIEEYLISPEYRKLLMYHPNITVETSLDISLLNISGSSVHLSKTVMNLVSNAAEAMPDGGTISITTENSVITGLKCREKRGPAGEYTILKISDTGMGMSPEEMEKIFEPFYSKKKMGRSGTGLGMAVVLGTVEDHKGYIDVKSSEGKGSCFTLYFPATHQEAEENQPQLSIEHYRGRGELILVIDDMKEQREIASMILCELGYSVMAVSSGEDAVEYVKKAPVDLLLLDMIMDRGMDGLDTYRQILEIRPSQKAVVVSGFSETDRVKELQRLGAREYIKKPYTIENIGLAVKNVLDGKSSASSKSNLT